MLIQESRLSEYYSYAEAIPEQEQSNIYLSVPFKIEKYFLEGNYIQLLNTTNMLPMKEYSYFIEKLIDTVRIEIAESIQKSCTKLNIEDACQLFLIEKTQIESFINSKKALGQESNIEWRLNGNDLLFIHTSEHGISIDSRSIIKTNIMYAEEMTKIV